MVGFLLVLLFVVAPLVELYVIIQVAQVIGGWETIALLILESIIGAWLLKRQGLSTLARISKALDEGRVPGKEMVDGFLLMVAGALMLAPGFVGDVIGYVLLFPPTRARVRIPPIRPVRAGRPRALFRIPLMRRFRDGRHGAFFASMGSAANGRFVGTFRVGDVYDATGRDAPPHDRPSLDP